MPGSIFNGRAASAQAPAGRLSPVTPDNGADLPGGTTRGLFVGGDGAVAVVDAEGGTAVIISAASQYHPIRVRRVLADGTTASDIVALY